MPDSRDGIYVVVQLDHLSGRIVHIELLDGPPRWPESDVGEVDHVLYVANVNGGDALQLPWPVK